MFLENKYTNCYRRLINSARIRGSGDEKHHILPRCMGGTDEDVNLVLLTFKEHYIAHLLLTRMVSTLKDIRAMWLAWHQMTFSINGRLNGNQFALHRKNFVNVLSKTHLSKRDPNAWSRKMSETSSAYWNSHRSDSQRKKMSNIRKEKWKDPTYAEKEKARLKALSLKIADEHLSRMAIPVEHDGVKYYSVADMSAQTGISESDIFTYHLKGIPIPPPNKLETDGFYYCPHCTAKMKSKANMRRFHYNNCKKAVKGGL